MPYTIHIDDAQGCAGLIAVFVMASDAEATVIGFDLVITATTSDSRFGTGVNAGDQFTGMMFFDAAAE